MRQVIVVLILAVVIATPLVYFTVNNSDSSADSQVAAEIAIAGSDFSPKTIKVKKGQDVTWMNQDSNPHQISADPYPEGGSLPDLNSQEPLGQGESYTFVFDKAGTYTYHDHLNPESYKGTVIVE